jgi:hypothetical protein
MKRFPIAVVDEHQEAFGWWCRARAEGLLPRPLDLIHLDAHDDMDVPPPFDRSVQGLLPGPCVPYDADGIGDFIRKNLHLSAFIVPAVLMGLVDNVHVVLPAWHPLRRPRRRTSVCSIFGEGRVLRLGLAPAVPGDPQFARLFPDRKAFTWHRRRLESLPRRRAIVLDIDLDYFACRESILNHMSFRLEITPAQFEAREAFLANPILAPSRLVFGFLKAGGRYFADISFVKTPEVAHLPDEAAIVGEIERLMRTLREKSLRPAVVTVSRSRFTGYCPAEIGCRIEPLLVEALLTLPGAVLAAP